MTAIRNPWLALRAPQLAVLALAATAVVLVFQGTFGYLFGEWQRDEYSHGFVIPLISAYLLWRQRARFAQLNWRTSWSGVALALLGLAIYFLGSLASITTVDAYALVIVIAGCVLGVMGWQAFKVALVPIALLFLMNPIPQFFYNNLSLRLQLLSSQMGVAFMRLAGVSVFLEGNVIDLGNYKLQVADACSGLRYLFPLMTLGVIIAYLFRGKAWMRWCLFLSTVPITVLMNSLRVGVIGILVDRYGIAQAEGFLHWFEGWVVFIACLLVLLAEGWALLRLTGDARSLREVLTPVAAPPAAAGATLRTRELGKPAVVVLLLLLAAVLPARALPQRPEVRPHRENFADFPLQVAGWRGRRLTMEPIYLDTLRLDDYVLVDFVRDGALPAGHAPARAPVNFYVAYYASQRNGLSAHSPRSCLPGGGWDILEFGQHRLPGAGTAGTELRVNRAIVQHGSERELVYYWFQERGRSITSEYLVKWYLLEDALLRNRTDGALVRLVTPLPQDELASAADARLAEFTASVLPTLAKYLPD
ncbi:MAG: VPLPA-CTERM-specific exosortase XrtD [Gammaproteobacteria bacterium]|nr:VPLPA-CTERM-specific exosortase XrtD [Gammaproteobacteria bacterium]